jgi:uncharacterized membrane protein YgdD (TMEM256/DUF423 family)
MIEPLRRRAGIAGCIFAGSAVLTGAFAAHALRDRLDSEAIAVWRTAVDYQFWHALALIGLACLPHPHPHPHPHPPTPTLRWAFRAFVFGVTVFSGSLYALALGGPRLLGLLTPFGGVSLLLGWCCLLMFFVRSRSV